MNEPKPIRREAVWISKLISERLNEETGWRNSSFKALSEELREAKEKADLALTMLKMALALDGEDPRPLARAAVSKCADLAASATKLADFSMHRGGLG